MEPALKRKQLKHADRNAPAKRALNALRRAKRTAEQTGVELSEWEGEFLGSVEVRVEKYGRAFADPDKGAINGALSLRQGLKLKQITDKAKGKDDKPARKSGFGKPKSGLKARSGFAKRSRPHGK